MENWIVKIWEYCIEFEWNLMKKLIDAIELLFSDCGVWNCIVSKMLGKVIQTITYAFSIDRRVGQWRMWRGPTTSSNVICIHCNEWHVRVSRTGSFQNSSRAVNRNVKNEKFYFIERSKENRYMRYSGQSMIESNYIRRIFFNTVHSIAGSTLSSAVYLLVIIGKFERMQFGAYRIYYGNYCSELTWHPIWKTTATP